MPQRTSTDRHEQRHLGRRWVRTGVRFNYVLQRWPRPLKKSPEPHRLRTLSSPPVAKSFAFLRLR